MIVEPTKDDRERKTEFQILLVEDNATDASLVQSHIEKFADFKLKSVEDLSQAMECLDLHSFDVILLDLNLPDTIGLEGLIKLRHHKEKIPIVVFTGIDDEELGIMALQRGAQDYLVKGIDNARLSKSIRFAIERMLVYRSDNTTENLDYPNSSNIKVKQHEILTERELHVLKLLGKGYNNQEIAERLVVSVNTIKTHIVHILQKLSVPDRTKAIIEAQQRGLI